MRDFGNLFSTLDRVPMTMSVIVLAATTFAATAQDQGGAPAPPAEEPATVDAPRLPDELRNPRLLRQEQGIVQEPRMVAGGLPTGGDGGLWFLSRLELIVGEFTFEGQQWMRADSEPIAFEGTWTNQWALDGQFLQSSFTLNDRNAMPYEVIGMMWYDENDQQFEATYYNSNNPVQTIRWGNFEGAATQESIEGAGFASPEIDEAPAEIPDDAPAEPPVLTMLARSSAQPETAEPSARDELVIVSVNEFRYLGYNRGRDNGEFRKTFEMTMTRIKPIGTDG